MSESAVVETVEPRGGTARAVFIVIALAAGFAAVPRMTHGCTGIGQGEPAPDFKARIVANPAVLGGTDVELKSLRGRAVVLDFWATWCGPCQAESPIVDAIAQRYKDKITVIGVNTSDEDGLAAAFARRKKLTFPIVYDEGNAIAKKYSVSTLPTLIVVSKTGDIVAVRHGVTTDEDLDDLVRRYM
jgi:cytochrome c biogenesis protein CcmG, thiol:disulfide interchange protein DsbE